MKFIMLDNIIQIKIVNLSHLESVRAINKNEGKHIIFQLVDFSCVHTKV